MTVSPASPGTDVAPFDPDEFGDVGLEDIGAGDVVMPRISIVHDEGKFRNNLTSEEFDTLTCVLLGVVKQRIFWDDDVQDNEKPLCKSPDFGTGFPQMREDIPADKRFPWTDSNFNQADFANSLINGHVALPCDKCTFASWGKDSSGKSTPPPCNEQHTYPLLYVDENGSYVPAIFTTQKTGIKPSKTYISGFASSRTPFFTVHTTLGLTLQKRGNVKYSVPTFRRGEATDRAFWKDWSVQARSIREFLRSAPRAYDNADEAAEASDNTNTGPTAPATPAASVSTPAPTQPSQPAAPATPPPAAPAPAQPTAPDAEPVPSGAPVDEDDDIPF